VAFTILALLLGTLLQIFARGLMAARLSDEYTRAVLLAESLLAELSSRGELAVGTESGALEGYRWTNRIAPYQPAGEEAEAGELPIAPQDLPMLPLVAVAEVAWGEGPEHRSVTLTTLLSGPTQETGFGKEPTREIPSPDSGNRSSR
jgi:general secretion pathway protein I